MTENKPDTKKKANLTFVAVVVVVFVVGVAAGIFAAPYVLYHGHYGNFKPGGFTNRTTSSANSTVHLPYAVDIAYKPGIGDYLVNSSGWALYMYVPDSPGSGKSTCYGQCAVVWPIFYTANLTVAPGINASLFGVINRTDGTRQVTFNGYPLYYYEYDSGANSINGQGSGKIWYVMSPTGTVIYNST